MTILQTTSPDDVVTSYLVARGVKLIDLEEAVGPMDSDETREVFDALDAEFDDPTGEIYAAVRYLTIDVAGLDSDDVLAGVFGRQARETGADTLTVLQWTEE